MMITLYLALAFLLLASFLFWLSTRQRKAAGLPDGRVIYTDMRAWSAVEKPLFYRLVNLTGKPDYLIEQNGKIIPVEVKTGRTPEAPYDSHIFQVAAYCMLVEKTFNKRPPYAIIHYQDRDFAVDYTSQLEAALLDVLADMRRDESRANVKRSHEEAHRCARCGFRAECDQRLA